MSKLAPSNRILAIDIFRGWTIAFMIIVNTPGNGDRSWSPLQHARWHGFTPTDLVFPSFLFIIGASAWFSLKKLQWQGISTALTKIWKRTAILFFLGMFMWYVPGFIEACFKLKLGEYLGWFVDHVRVLGVLGRLALCYGIGCTLALKLSQRGLTVFSLAALAGYWALMFAFGSGADPYALETNAALRFDRWLLGAEHLYHGESVLGKPYAFDPEGVLSTLPAIVTFIIGYRCGQKLDGTPDRRYALSDLFPAGLGLVAAGFLWDYWLGFPINKKLWTSSYTLYVGGLSMLLLCMSIWLVDVQGRARLLGFFDVFGKNPLLAYMVSEMGVVTLQSIGAGQVAGRPITAFEWLYTQTAVALAGDNGLGSFVFSFGYMLACWLVSWWVLRRGLILKV